MNEMQVAAFREWFNSQWLGDQENGQYIPQAPDPDYDRYLLDYGLALGAWIACLDYNKAHNARITDAIAKNVGIRWCSTCQRDKPAEGFIKKGCRWICRDCRTRRMNGTPSSLYGRPAR